METVISPAATIGRAEVRFALIWVRRRRFKGGNKKGASREAPEKPLESWAIVKETKLAYR
ncbi:hypothetical protein E4K72_16680 [Oxalobacteraceae bacterium OM1]|nr:hypothetical protein E4K72_16680 [Oxalobacteraceae bacterium OM1]